MAPVALSSSSSSVNNDEQQSPHGDSNKEVAWRGQVMMNEETVIPYPFFF